jgi:hypothetical protein
MFSYLSHLSSAENAYPPWAPLGTRKHISRKPAAVIVNARSVINEPWAVVGQEVLYWGFLVCWIERIDQGEDL